MSFDKHFDVDDLREFSPINLESRRRKSSKFEADLTSDIIPPENSKDYKLWRKVAGLIFGKKEVLRSFLYSINDGMYKELRDQAKIELKEVAKLKKKYAPRVSTNISQSMKVLRLFIIYCQF